MNYLNDELGFASNSVRIRSSTKTRRYGNFCKDLIKRDIKPYFDIYCIIIKPVSVLLQNTNTCAINIFFEKDIIVEDHFQIIRGDKLHQQYINTKIFKPGSRITAQLASIQRNFECELTLLCSLIV